jgi:hypothetical protein
VRANWWSRWDWGQQPGGVAAFAGAVRRVGNGVSLRGSAVLRGTGAIQRDGCDSDGRVWELMRSLDGDGDGEDDDDDGRIVARPRGWGMWLAHAPVGQELGPRSTRLGAAATACVLDMLAD